MKTSFRRVAAFVTSSISLSMPAWANPTYYPTSVELLYQPIASSATGGQGALSPAGAGLRIGYAMAQQIAFELGGYYDGFVFGGIPGGDITSYAFRATGDFAYAPAPSVRLYAGADALAFPSLPSVVASTGSKDLGVFSGVRYLTGTGNTKFLVGAEYRYALNVAYSAPGVSITTSAVVGTVGLHFGGL